MTFPKLGAPNTGPWLHLKYRPLLFGWWSRMVSEWGYWDDELGPMLGAIKGSSFDIGGCCKDR